MKLLHVAVDVYEEQIRAGRDFLHEHPLGASSWWDPRMTALQKTTGVHCIFADVLLSSEDRDEEWFEKCQQVRVQTD